MDSIILEEAQLRRVASVTTLEECVELAIFSRLTETLSNCKSAYGLCAGQIGQNIRACILKCDDLKVNMINPKILKKHDLMMSPEETCLSMKSTYNTVRYSEVVVQWFDEVGVERTAVFIDKEAFAVQHLIDHMNGRLIKDIRVKQKVTPVKRSSAKVGRNALCPCKSGKKYKKCCMDKEAV